MQVDTLFQFHNGSIKSQYRCRYTVPLPSFNSTMVRLKDGYDDDEVYIFYEFQFHNGSIKRPIVKASDLPLDSFNSTMVRLKACKQTWCSNERDGFNSTMVRLKVELIVAADKAHDCFNSTMVRLKEMAKQLKRPRNSSFNSTMVRLKARKNQQRYYTKPTLFLQGENCLQFQKSSTSGCAKFTGG